MQNSNPATVLVKKTNQQAQIPQRANNTDAGLDLWATHDAILNPHEPVKIATGIAMAIPDHHVGLICDRSSMGSKGIRTLGGVVDSGYRGEIQVILINLKNQPQAISKGDKIAQILILPISLAHTTEVSNLDRTSRGENGFGSTGQ